MSNSIKGLLAIALVGFISACAQKQAQEEYVVVDSDPITVEPVFTGKYK